MAGSARERLESPTTAAVVDRPPLTLRVAAIGGLRNDRDGEASTDRGCKEDDLSSRHIKDRRLTVASLDRTSSAVGVAQDSESVVRVSVDGLVVVVFRQVNRSRESQLAVEPVLEPPASASQI